MEKNIQGLTGKDIINLMILIASMPVGGVENQLLSIVQRLHKQNYNITICCIRDVGVLGEKAAGMGINIVPLHLMQSNRISLNIPYRLSRIIKEKNVHILWTHQYVANFYGRIASLLSRTPVVISNFHSLYDNPKTHRKIFNHLLSYRTDALVAVSEAVASDVRSFDRINSKKVKVIYNGIDISLFDVPETKTDCRKKLGLPPKDIIVGTIGRLSKEKNHGIIIEALHSLPGDVKGLIIGDGPLKKTLEDSGGKRFYFTGQMQYTLIPYALKSMDIFCFVSLWEGFGIALVEAMAAGLPIVASDIPPHREVLGDTGIRVPLKDAKSLAKAIKTLISDVSLKDTMSAQSRERARIFSIEKTVKAYKELFMETLRKKVLL